MNVLERTLVKKFTGMIIASIGRRAADFNILEQLGQEVGLVDYKLAQRKNSHAQSHVSKNLKKVLDDPKVGNFYKVRLNGALAVLESVILINLIASSKGEGKDYLMLTAGVATLSATAFTMYAAYIDLSYGKRSVVVRASATSYLGKFSFWGGSLNFLAGGALAVSDFIDAGKSDKGILMYGYYFRFSALIAYSVLRYTIAIEASAAWFDFVSKTTKSKLIRSSSKWLLELATSNIIRTSVPRMLMWVPYLGLLILVVTIGLLIFEPNVLETWFKRCCFGKRELKDKYQNIEEEMSTLSLAVQECI